MIFTMRKYPIAILIAMQAAFAKPDPCKDETQKAENIYELCVKFDKQSAGYIDCVKLYIERKAQADELCKAIPLAPPAPWIAPVPVEAPIPNPAVAPAVPVAAPVAAPALAPAPTFVSSAVSSSCMSEFIGVSTSNNFDLLNFVKKLPPEVLKVKAQMKLPFGKPADGKKTNIGITVGCLKDFPETPKEIMPLLKDVSIEMAIGIVAVKAGISRSQIPNEISQLRDLALQNGAQSVANALSFLAGSEAPVTDDEPKEENSDKKGVRVGVRIGANINDFYFGYSVLSKEIGIGWGAGIGMTLNIPVASIFRFNLGWDFYYRQLFNGFTYYNDYSNDGVGNIHEYVVSIPVLLQLGNSFYFTTGIQLDIPIETESRSSNGDDYFAKNRYLLDFGLALGLGYRFTNFGLDFKYVYSLTNLFEDFSYNNYTDYKDKSLLMQYGLGVSYFF
jgi:hypothetical protein